MSAMVSSVMNNIHGHSLIINFMIFAFVEHGHAKTSKEIKPLDIIGFSFNS